MQTINRERIAIVARHYLIAAVWADCQEGTSPRVTAQAKRAAFNICNTFVSRYPGLFAEAMNRKGDGYGAHPDCEGKPEAAFGHDLWLTTRGHGAGFWDRNELDADDLGKRLSDACHEFGEPSYDQSRGWFYLYEGASVRPVKG